MGLVEPAMLVLAGANGLLVWAPEAPFWLRQVPAVETLRRVWLQQYAREVAPNGVRVRWR